jgi:hypothetical protein
LQKELLKKTTAKQGCEDLEEKIDALREEKQSLQVNAANRARMKTALRL